MLDYKRLEYSDNWIKQELELETGKSAISLLNAKSGIAKLKK